MKDRKFFLTALTMEARIYRSHSLCGCDSCLMFLKYGVTPTNEDDVNRFMKEQEDGVSWSDEPFKYKPFKAKVRVEGGKAPEDRGKGLPKHVKQQLKDFNNAKKNNR